MYARPAGLFTAHANRNVYTSNDCNGCSANPVNLPSWTLSDRSALTSGVASSRLVVVHGLIAVVHGVVSFCPPSPLFPKQSLAHRIIYILKAQLFFVCLSRINWKDYESQRAENLLPGVILYCDNDLLVFEAKFGIMTSQLRKTDI